MIRAIKLLLRSILPDKIFFLVRDVYYEFVNEVITAPNFPSFKHSLKYRLNRLHSLFLKAIRSTRVAYPHSILVEVTNLCNLKCIMCPREHDLGQQMEKGFMNIEDFKKIIDEVYPYVKSIGLIGLGETLLYYKLEDAVNYVNSKSRGISIFTSINAHSPDCVEIVSSLAGKMSFFQISADGIDEIYDDIRKGGEYSLFIENTRKIVGIATTVGARVKFNMVVYHSNYLHMTKVVQLAYDMGIHGVSFYPVNLVAVTGWDTEGVYGFYESEEFKEELVRAKKLARSLDIILGHFNFEGKNGFQRCNYPWQVFSITWDGYLTPCPCKPFPLELNFGNVVRNGLLDCLNSKPFRQFRRMWFSNETPDFCKDCSYIDIPPVKISVSEPAQG